MLKLFVSDIDGTLTDGTVFASNRGEEMKKFSLRDGRGFHLLQLAGVKVCLMTSEVGGINKARADKLINQGVVDYLYECGSLPKITSLLVLCEDLGIELSEVAYIGDDTNDYDCLKAVGYKACPYDGHIKLLEIKDLKVTTQTGGCGAVREFIEMLFMEGAINEINT